MAIRIIECKLEFLKGFSLSGGGALIEIIHIAVHLVGAGGGRELALVKGKMGVRFLIDHLPV